MADCPASLASHEEMAARGQRLRVLLPLPLPAALDYRAPQHEAPPEPGRFVRVNLGPRRIIGVVWDGEGEDVAEERLRPIADGLGIRLSQLALAWVLREPNVASAIVGASRPQQVEDNVAASGIELDAETLQRIDQALEGSIAYEGAAS